MTCEQTSLETGDIQGIVISGYKNLIHSSYLFLHITDRAKAKAWLASLICDITTAHRETTELGHAEKPACALNIAFTVDGLAALGLQESLHTFPQEFVEGMAQSACARRLGDNGDSAPETWEIGNPVTIKQQPETEIHVLLIVQAGQVEPGDAEADEKWVDQSSIENYRQKHRKRAEEHGLRVVGEVQEGHIPKSGQEHFGFADAISDPNIEGSPKPVRDNQPIIRAGEFILGYRNEYGNFPPLPTVPSTQDIHGHLRQSPHGTEPGEQARRDFGRNGTYLVFRKLRQHTADFHRFLRDHTSNQQGRDLLAAKMIGRWPSGAPLVHWPKEDPDPHNLVPALARDNDFSYAGTDPRGYACPFGAHIRRSNPRDSLGPDVEQAMRSVSRHRILRRGALYGEPATGDLFKDDKRERGVLFLALNADIKRQFEFIQQTWINNPKFHGLYNDKDPLLGDNDESSSQFTIQEEPVRQRICGFSRFVTMRGGAYFFLPGISALWFLAEAPDLDPSSGETGYSSPFIEESPPPGEAAAIQQIEQAVLTKWQGDNPPQVGLARRDAHPKAHGGVHARFIVQDDLPLELQHGVLREPKEYEAFIRFSASASPMQPDTSKDAHGMAIKLLGVEGEKLSEDTMGPLSGTKFQSAQDFVLLNHPVFFIRNASDFAALITAATKNNKIESILSLLWFFLGLNPFRWKLREFKEMFATAGHTVFNPLQIQYWSQTPYCLGPHAVKYSARPRLPGRDTKPISSSPNSLREAMVQQLRTGEARFDFMVQLRTDRHRMPIEDALVPWDEDLSPFHTVAVLIIPPQEFDIPNANDFTENLSFSPWHALPEHRPLGGINRARRSVYETIAKLRRQHNAASGDATK